MRAQTRRHNNLIGSKWLRNGGDHRAETVNDTGSKQNLVPEKVVRAEQSVPELSARDRDGQKLGDTVQQNDLIGKKVGNLNFGDGAEGGKNIKLRVLCWKIKKGEHIVRERK